MATRQTDDFYYVDGGNAVRKRTWLDTETGESWDTFDQVTDDQRFSGLGDGTIVNGPNDPGTERATQDDLAAQEAARQRGMASQGSQDAQKAPQSPQGPAAPQAPQSGGTGADGGFSNQSSRVASPATAPSAPQGGGGSRMSANPNMPYAPAPRPQGAATGAADARNQFLYNWADPQGAMANALRDMGIATYTANPVINSMLRSAPGLAAAYQLQGALGGGRGADNTDFGGFGDFLRSAISGGNIRGTLQSAMSQFPSLVDTLRGYASAQNGPADASNPMNNNGFLRDLFETFKDPGNLSGFEYALQSPFMNRGSATALQNQLGNRQAVGFQNFFGPQGAPRDTTQDDATSIWRYILGY